MSITLQKSYSGSWGGRGGDEGRREKKKEKESMSEQAHKFKSIRKGLNLVTVDKKKLFIFLYVFSPPSLARLSMQHL